MKKLILVMGLIASTGLWAECIEDLGTPSMFGSYDLVADTPLVCFWKNDEGNEIIK